MTTTVMRPTATAEIDAQVTVGIDGGQVMLDALAVPYASANIEVAITEDLNLEDLDPRDDVRVVITASDEAAGTSRSFNLGMRSREIDHEARAVRIELASDEAILQDYVALTLDRNPRLHEASIRGVCNYVLGKVGASLQAGGPDANVAARWQLDNLIGNPTFQISTVQWMTASNGGALSWSSTGGMGGIAGPGCAVAGVGSNGTAGAHWGGGPNGLGSIVKCKSGDTFTGSVYIQSSQTRDARLHLRFVDESGFYTDVEGPIITIGPNVWYRATVTGTCPAGRTGCSMYVLEYGITSGGFLVLDAAMLNPGAELVPYFDGLTPADANYTYVAAGTPHQSATTRKPVVNRPPELYIWRPGTSAWDFLEPLTSSVGLRLFCDEHRVWRLIDPGTYVVPGMVTAAGFNSVRGLDTITRDDADIFATGVVCRYGWEDEWTGETFTAYDAAGTPERVFVIDYSRPYPGPGAAAAILARRDGMGRTQDVTALNHWPTTPGQEASITLPGAPQQKGKVSSVNFSLGDDGLMDLGTRGLIDILAGSWAAAPETQTWANVPGSWTTYAGREAEDE